MTGKEFGSWSRRREDGEVVEGVVGAGCVRRRRVGFAKEVEF